jgi:transposase-like protein
MQCIGCGSTAVSERNGRTTQGYRRFRRRACGKQFDERSESPLNRTHRAHGALARNLAGPHGRASLAPDAATELLVNDA